MFNNVAEVISFMIVFLSGTALSDLDLLMMQLHFGHALPDRCRRQKVPSGNASRILGDDKVCRLSP
jgi:hypothetical protein